MFELLSHQVTQLKIFTNQFAAAFRKRATTPAEIATRQAAVRAVKKEPCDRARNGRSANGCSTSHLCHSPLPLTAANSSAGGHKSSSSKEVVSVLIDPNELPDLTDIPTGQLLSLSLSLSLGVLSFESHSLSHTHSFSSLLYISLTITLSHPLSPQVFYLSLFLSSDMLQDTAHPVATIDYDEEEEDVEMWSDLNTYLTDEPPHIRPFYFQPRYHYGLDPAYHSALIHNTSLPSRPLPPPHSRQMTAARKTTSSVSGTGPFVPDASGAGAGAGSSGDGGGVDQEMLWSSVAVYGTDPGDGSTDDADSFGLRLLGKSL